MKTRYLLCEKCKEKVREAEAKYKYKSRKLKIKLKELQQNGQVELTHKSRAK